MSQGRVCRLDAGYWSSQGRVEKGWNWVAECNIQRPSQTPSLVVGSFSPLGDFDQWPDGVEGIGHPREERVLVIPNARIARLMSRPWASSIWACRYSGRC